MELRWLETYLTIVERGSFTRAAEQLHLSQPAVTRQVAALEEHCGGALLERTTRRVELTAAGERMRDHARRILGAVADCNQALADLRAGLAGRLTLGASGTVATYFLPTLLARYRAQHPRHDLSVHTGLSSAIVEQVAAGSLDLGLVMDFRDHPGLTERPLGHYAMAVILPVAHPLAKARHLMPADLAQQPFISMEPGTNLRRFTDDWFNGQAPPPVMELDNIEAIKRMVEAGLGIAVVPLVAVRGENIVAKPLGRARRWSVVYRRGRALTPLMEAFLAVTASSNASHSPDGRRARRPKGSPPPARRPSART